MLLAHPMTSAHYRVSAHHIAHDLPDVTWWCDIMKTSSAKRGWRPHIGVEAWAGLHGIPLDHRGALRSDVLQRSLQQAQPHSLPPHLAVDEEADHRPHRCLIEPCKGAEPFKGGVRLPWGDRAPADRLAVQVREHADRRAMAHQIVERSDPAFFGRPLVVCARQTPPHAGTVAELPMPLGEASQVRQPLWDDGTIVEHRRLLFRRLEASTAQLPSTCAPWAGTR